MSRLFPWSALAILTLLAQTSCASQATPEHQRVRPQPPVTREEGAASTRPADHGSNDAGRGHLETSDGGAEVLGEQNALSSCAARWAALRSALAGREHSVVAAELRRLAAEYREARARGPGHPHLGCPVELEAALRQLAFAWLGEDRHHRVASYVRELLEFHSELFPDHPEAALVAYRLGEVIAELTWCGCKGKQFDVAEWRQAAGAFRHAGELGRSRDLTVAWRRSEYRLTDAALRAEALCLSNVANPLEAPSGDTVAALLALEEALQPERPEVLREGLDLRRKLLELARDAPPATDPRWVRFFDATSDYDLSAVAAEVLALRVPQEGPQPERGPWVDRLLRSGPVEQYAHRYPSLRQCLVGTRADACNEAREGHFRWNWSGRIR